MSIKALQYPIIISLRHVNGLVIFVSTVCTLHRAQSFSKAIEAAWQWTPVLGISLPQAEIRCSSASEIGMIIRISMEMRLG